MKLSPEQIAIIRNLLEENEVSTDSLKDDLLDHICCVVERRLTDGATFPAALQDALTELAPHGLADIQQKTYITLQSPRLLLMKKVIYTIGLFSAAAISIGWMFSLLRWPGGYELFNYGSLIFLLVFVPLLAVSRAGRKSHRAWWARLANVTGLASSVAVGMSVAFKFGHLQGADWLLFFGVLLFSGCFLPLLFFSLYKNEIANAS